jgi:hypothetical protein
MATAQELMDRVRKTLDDEIGVEADRLWTEIELLEYANDAEREACIRMRILVDSTTAATSEVTVVSGTHTYALSSKVVSVDRAKMQATADPALHPITKKILDITDPAWEVTSEVPRNYIIEDIDTVKSMRLYPNPNANGVLGLTVVRLPLAIMAAGDVPEIPEPLHLDLMNWMLYRAYTKQDTKVAQDTRTVSLTKEKFYLAQFEKVFGERKPVFAGFTKSSLFRE